jgi:hypothetical protein
MLRTPRFQGSKVPGFRVQGSGFLVLTYSIEPQNCGTVELWNCGTVELWNFGTLEL